MAVIRADLAGLPARYGNVAILNLAQDLLDMTLGVPLLLTFEAEGMHGGALPIN